MKKIILCSCLMAMCLILETFAICNIEGKVLQTGEKVSTSGCVQSTCNEDGTVFGITCPEYACAHGEIGPRKEDLSKPYPQCCPQLQCRE